MKVLTLNIQAAGLARARQLLAWLDTRDDDVLILTETSDGPGTAHLLGQCRAAGWSVMAPRHEGERGCAIVARLPLEPLPELTTNVSIASRVAAGLVSTQPAVAVMGIYAPSNDRAQPKAAKKRDFLTSVSAALEAMPAATLAHLIIGGDYNLIARDHVPAYPGVFTPDDYAFLDTLSRLGLTDAHRHLHPADQPHSWIGHRGNGYRYDYLHVGTALAALLSHSSYLHQTRAARLSDHAAVSIELQLAADHLDAELTVPVASAGALF